MKWGAVICPLNLGAYNDLSWGSINNFPKFNGNGKFLTKEYIASFFASMSLITIQFENFSMQLLVEMLVDRATKMFATSTSKMHYQLDQHETTGRSQVQKCKA